MDTGPANAKPASQAAAFTFRERIIRLLRKNLIFGQPVGRL